MDSQLKLSQACYTRGYLEGYYGKLLSWSERTAVIECLASLQLNSYCYAPKEDPQHRLHWRDPYESHWLDSFNNFCSFANRHHVDVAAGIAPGLDFNFGKSSDDFDSLNRKAGALKSAGADQILILWDDIEASDGSGYNGLSEGTSHARIVNKLADIIGQPLWTVPRVYAAEIENSHNYLADFFTELQPEHTVLLCGNAIVTSHIQQADLKNLSPAVNGNQGTLKHRTVVWDNFYANDYCPRRLFIGPWTGREEITNYLLNPTGMPYTDQLLLDIASATQLHSDQHNVWMQALKRHGVPDAFMLIAPWFDKPFFGDRQITGKTTDLNYIKPTPEVENAIEECLWKWKTPLAREWYPFIFGLKHDLALMQNALPRDRILKTQSSSLSSRLLS